MAKDSVPVIPNALQATHDSIPTFKILPGKDIHRGRSLPLTLVMAATAGQNLDKLF